MSRCYSDIALWYRNIGHIICKGHEVNAAEWYRLALVCTAQAQILTTTARYKAKTQKQGEQMHNSNSREAVKNTYCMILKDLGNVCRHDDMLGEYLHTELLTVSLGDDVKLDIAEKLLQRQARKRSYKDP